ncbi:hypothetical protein PVL29_005343 [Vitis rotundifolia]|uniref:Uncharacterized protein n=1 Tax=Vitis rotundifolia TaxID=103349 RepID=A0AA39AAH4_VITRO|nr:hypothetical protein PVL29_005343 [Vitis rotundifolia]
MASTTLLFLLLSAFCVAAAAQQRGSNISRGSSLTPTSNSFWLSPNRLYAFGFYKEGDGYYVGIFLNGIPQKTIVWTANRDDPPVPSTATLHFTSEGRLRLQTQGQQKEIVNSASASSASMLDSGNFVLYNSDGEMVWQSFDLPTDTLLLGQRLSAGKELFSIVSETNPSTGMFRLKMQNDGNLVQYPVKTPDTATYAYYATNTGGVGDNVTLHLDGGGHLYLVDTNGFNILNITDGGYDNGNLYLLRIDPDGIFKLYSHDLGQKAAGQFYGGLQTTSVLLRVYAGLMGFVFCLMTDLAVNVFLDLILLLQATGICSTPAKQPCWVERVGIALNVAKGILYLHEECETQIIHCDIKPQNILMDEYRCAKISDFGLAKLLMHDQTNTFTGIRGTRGYVAPEWHRKLAVTVKADVYSYGILLLETICCRRNVDWSLPEEEAILEGWVYHCFEAGELGKLVGDEEVDKRQLERMVKVGLWCILDEPSLRPSMNKVLLMLEGTVDIPVPPSPGSFLSSI